MEWLKRDLNRYTATGLILITCLGLGSSALLVSAVVDIATGGYQRALVWALLMLIMAVTSAQHPLKFLNNGTAVSVSEALIFLAIIMLGPNYGIVLAAVDMFLVSRQLKLKLSNYILNISHITISVYGAGLVYYAVSAYVESLGLTAKPGQMVLVMTLPLVAMALTDYVLQFTITAVVAGITHLIKISDRIRETFPWEPISFLASATVAGLINYSFGSHGIGTTLLIMLLVMPIPVIIYYTFKNYHEKMSEQQNHYQELTGIYDSILEMLAMAIDAKDDVTHDHIQRVKLFARRVGEIVGLSEMEIEALKAGALLHDIGKIGVPAYILNKPGKLTEHEFEQMKMHTIIGADMLSNVDFRYPVVPIVRHHHERWDGKGYPDGLSGEDIPITARILTLVDNYDALRSDRPYKKGMSREEALAFIKKNAGAFFDPKLVEVFLSIIDDLEIEAANFKSAPKIKRVETTSSAMAKARPATGFANAPEVDRATAALNSIAETNQRVTALYEMARTLASNLSVEDTVAILASRLSKLMPFTTCAISLFDPTRSEFEVAHASGRHAEKFMRRRLPAEAGITGWVITNQLAMYNTNPVLDLGFLGTEAASEYKGVIVFPLIKNKEPLGAIALYSTEIESYGSEHIQLMESVVQPASDAVYNALAFEQAQRHALTDPVTGLANMRALFAQFERERVRSQRLGTPLTLLAVTIKNLDEAIARAKNDTEQVLASICKVIKQQVRESDLVARHSDNTFVAILSESGRAEATQVRGRVRKALAMVHFGGNLSVSIGAATSPEDGTSFDALLTATQADRIDCSEAITADLVFTEMKDELAIKPS